jgi:O-antigen/teichoic acid export membrane protein
MWSSDVEKTYRDVKMITQIRSKLQSLRHACGDLWWYATWMLISQVLFAGVNFYTGLWLIPRVVSQSELGALLPLMQIAAFLATPLVLLLTPFAKFLNTFMVTGETGKAKALLYDACRVSLVFAGVMVLYTLALAPFIQLRLRVGGLGVVILLCGLAFVNGIKPVLASSMQALKKFDNMLVGGSLSAPLRLVLIWTLAGSFGVVGYLGAQFALEVALLLIGGYSLISLLGHQTPRVTYRDHWRDMFAFSVPLVISGMIGSFAATIDPFIIRHRLPEIESAAYYVISRFSEQAGCIGGVFGVLLFPMFSERFETGRSSRRLLWEANVANGVIGGFVVVGLAVFGADLLGMRPQWAVYSPYANQMWQLGLLQVLCVPISIFQTHEIACRRFGFLWYTTGISLFRGGILYGLTGWEFFRPYLPAAWWELVNRLHACRLSFVVIAALLTQIVILLCIGAHLTIRRLRSRNGSKP